jgi:hypothetical protein
MKLRSKRTLVLLGVLAGVAVFAAAGAYAYFTSTGHGSGSAAVGTSTAWQVNTDAYSGGPLTPGGGSATYESIKYRVKNNNSGQQALANVNIKVAGTDGSGNATVWSAQADSGKPACSKDDFRLSVDGGTTWAAAGASVDDAVLAGNLAPGATTTSDGTIMIRMVDSGANQDNCKSQSVPLYLYAS